MDDITWYFSVFEPLELIDEKFIRVDGARLLIVEVASDDDEVDVLVECDLDNSTESFVCRSLQALSQ
ncbi:hypothetical protein C481_19846 [Natrialba asiatica DSM 12278]|uniref:Uncharacterized protein n=1 Tax=Natrialba asiatica (strain ATCC 700177 / DSM 12278 / JCM 9576 / FERM P-10747 / NBRC 102637 / 172P1) TaxID=29540 RepID=M0AHG1_NATA1|nr:hypothetical protein C481_19846 [Natrialba asiatica DSM 12278]